MSVRIPVADLVDQYREPFDVEGMPYEPGWPTLYRISVGGTSWLSDRFWLLPETACELPDGINVEPLPASNIEQVAGWVADLLGADLGPCNRLFGPCFAGTFTLAGLRALAIPGREMAALVTAEGDRLGVLMPHKIDTAQSVPIPVPPETVALFHRIHAADVVGYWQAWNLAVHLTSDETA